MIHPRHAIALAGFVLCLSSADVASAGTAGSPPPATDAQGGGDLSDKLSTSNGVIHPKTNVDPGMGKVPEEPGMAKTPVIPPPGTSGGATDVQPK